MNTLGDAWRWYAAVKQQAKLARRLAAKHWGDLPWNDGLGRDVFLRELDPAQVVKEAEFITDELADLAVVVLFSVFEAAVRETVLAEIKPEVEQLRHPALRHAADDARDWIAEGSFFRVLQPFKAEGQADLVEQVNQVRRYRNWVAHGRRGPPPATTTPEAAYERLQQFLTVIQPPPEAV
jgi:hypothetical protein